MDIETFGVLKVGTWKLEADLPVCMLSAAFMLHEARLAVGK